MIYISTPVKKLSCSSCGRTYIQGEECKRCSEKKRKQRNKYQRNYYKENKDLLKPLGTKRWSDLREVAIQRDLGVCQRCKIKYDILNSKELEVHHIKSRVDFPELMFEITNVITVCKTCNLQLGTSNRLDFTPNQSLNEPLDYSL